MIKVCIPYYSEYTQTTKGVEEVKASGLPVEVLRAKGPLVAQSRNALVNEQASQAIFQEIKGGYSHFLFVDSDIGFSLKHVVSLVRRNLDIVAAPYLRHGRKDQYQAGTFREPGVIGSRFTPDTKGLKVVDWCGAGFLLVKAAVFPKLRYPWFRYGLVEQNGTAEILGEDMGFCMNAKACGYATWCDFDIPVYHRDRPSDYSH